MYVTWPALYMGKTIKQLKKTLKKNKKLKKFCYLFVFEKKKSLLNRPQLCLIKNGRKKTKEERKKSWHICSKVSKVSDNTFP